MFSLETVNPLAIQMIEKLSGKKEVVNSIKTTVYIQCLVNK